MTQSYSILRTSASFAHYESAFTHCRVLKWGSAADVYTANNLITRYAKAGELGDAQKLFDEMLLRDSVSWNAIIAGYVNHGNFRAAWDLLGGMRRDRFLVDGYTFGSILKGIAYTGQLTLGKQVHSLVVKTGYQLNVVTGSSLLDMYSKCGRVVDARLVFEQMPECNFVSWNALIAGYVEESDRETALSLFQNMEKEGQRIEDGTVSPLVTLLNEPNFYALIKQMHGKVIKCGLGLSNNVCNAFITSYSECGSLQEAEKIFYGSAGIHDTVTWNSMLGAYLLHSQEKCAFQLFVNMQEAGYEPDIYTYTSLISTCFDKAFQESGRSLHCLVIKKGLIMSTAISNSLIAMYLKSDGKSMEDALQLFWLVDLKDCVTWNSILTGFSQSGLSENALELFGHMRRADTAIDHYSFSAVLRSCSDLAMLQLGRQIHVLAFKSGWGPNEHVNSSLITMYSRCGMIEDARKSFDDGPKDSSITWNFIIFAYAQHGLGQVALGLFNQMRECTVEIDHITFVAVLTACSHMGLVEEGRHFLNTMESEYGVPLRMEHYACGIDLFGRAGLLQEAKSLINTMPFKPDTMVWKTFLGACRNFRDVDLASEVANHLLQLEPEEHCTYVVLSDIYGRLKRWGEKASLTKLMKDRGVKKVPGWSWVEIDNKVHAFNAEDCSHPLCEQIYRMLEQLTDEVQRINEAYHLEILTCDFNHPG